MKQPDSEIRYKFKQLINYKWRKVFYYSLIYTLVYLLMNILAYLYFGYQASPAVGVILLILHILFILFNVKLYSSALRISSRDLKNWLDLGVHGYSLAICFISLLGIIRNESVMAYLKIIAIGVVSVRGIIQLKVFSGTRALIMLMGQILVDLTWVPFVFTGVLLLAATIYRMIPTHAGTLDESLTFLESVKQIFMLIFLKDESVTSGTDTSTSSGIARSIVLLVGGTILMQGVFNFVIAIFIQTFQRVKDDKEVYELRSLLLEIVDYDVFLKGFKLTPEKAYYMFLVPIPKDGRVFENETHFDRANKIKDDLLVEIGKKGIEMVGEKAKEVFKGQEKNIDKGVAFVKENAKETDPRVQKLLSAAQNLSEGKKPEMGEIINLIDLLGDAAEGKVRNVITKTRKAADLAFKYADDVANSRDPGLEQLMDVIISMVEAADDGGFGVGKHLTFLRKIVYQCVEQAKDIKSGRVELEKILDLVTDITTSYGTHEVFEKINCLIAAMKCILSEGRQFAARTEIDFVAILKSLASAIQNCGAPQIAESLKKDACIKTAQIGNVLVKHSAKLNETDVPALMLTASELVGILVTSESHKSKIKTIGNSCSALYRAGKMLSSSPKSENRPQQIRAILEAVSSVVKEFAPEQANTVEKLEKICLAVAFNSEFVLCQKNPDLKILIQGAGELVKLILPGKDPKQVEDAVTKAVSTIQIVVTKLSDFSTDKEKISLSEVSKNLPTMIENTAEIIKLVYDNKELHEKINMVVLTSKVVQTQIDIAGRLSSTKDVFKMATLGLDILAALSPKLHKKVRGLSELLKKMEKSYAELSNQGIKTNIPHILCYLGDLATVVDEDLGFKARSFLELSKFLFMRYEKLSLKLQNQAGPLEYIMSVCETMEQVCARYESELSVEVAKYCKGVVGILRAANEVKVKSQNFTEIDPEILFTNASEAIKYFHPEAGAIVKEAVPIFMIFKLCWKGQAIAKCDDLQKYLLDITNSIQELSPGLKSNLQILTNLINGVFAFAQHTQLSREHTNAVNVKKIIVAAKQVVKAIDPKLADKVEPFANIAEVLVQQASKDLFSSSKQDLSQLVAGVGAVVCVLDKKYEGQVQKVVEMSKLVDEVAKNRGLQNISKDSVIAWFDMITGIFSELGNKEFNTSLAIVKPAIKSLIVQMVDIKDLGNRLKIDPTNSVRQVLDLVKKLVVHFKPDVSNALAKVEFVVMGVTGELEHIEKSGKIDYERMVTFSTDLVCQYSEKARRPAKLIRGVMGLVYKLSQVDDLKTLNWKVFADNLCHIGEFVGDGHREQIISCVNFAEKAVKLLETIVWSSTVGDWVFSPVIDSMQSVVVHFHPEYSRKLKIWCQVIKALELELYKSKEVKNVSELLQTISSVAKVVSIIDKKYEASAVAISEMASNISIQMEKLGSNSGSQTIAASVVSVFQSLLIATYPNHAKDERLTKALAAIQASVRIFDQMVHPTDKTRFSEILDSMNKAITFFLPKETEKMDACVAVARLLETRSFSYSKASSKDLELLVDSVLELTSKFVRYDPVQKVQTGTIIKKTLAAIIVTQERFKSGTQPFADTKAVTEAAVEVIKTVYPTWQPTLQRFEALLQILESEVAFLESSAQFEGLKRYDTRAIIATLQRVILLCDPGRTSVAYKIGQSAEHMLQLIPVNREVAKLEPLELFKLMFGAIAVVNLEYRSQIEGFINGGLDTLQTATESSLQKFLESLRTWATVLPIPGLRGKKLELFISAIGRALNEVQYFSNDK